MFAVTCHRLVLLDPQAVASRIAPRWSSRETRFFMWMVLVWAVFLGTVWGLSMLMLNTWVAWVEVPERAWFDWTVLAAKVPAFYLVARISPVFPATAIDRKVDIRWAWRLTANNGWRLVLLVAVLPWVISHAVGLLYRGDPSVLETVVLTFVACALFAVEVAAISLAYRELTKGKDLTPG
jgi:hypothetical protein